jgi:hypothetical protein
MVVGIGLWIFVVQLCVKMPLFKLPRNFKFKYFYSSQKLGDGVPLATFNWASSSSQI